MGAVVAAPEPRLRTALQSAAIQPPPAASCMPTAPCFGAKPEDDTQPIVRPVTAVQRAPNHARATKSSVIDRFYYLVLFLWELRAMIPCIKRLDHVQITIPVGCEPQARVFYGDILGLQEIEKPEALRPNGGMWYQAADIQIHIGVEGPQSISKRHPAFEVEGLSALRQRLEVHGVRIKEDIPIPGVQRFSCFDPFDNRIEFLEKDNA